MQPPTAQNEKNFLMKKKVKSTLNSQYTPWREGKMGQKKLDESIKCYYNFNAAKSPKNLLGKEDSS